MDCTGNMLQCMSQSQATSDLGPPTSLEVFPQLRFPVYSTMYNQHLHQQMGQMGGHYPHPHAMPSQPHSPMDMHWMSLDEQERRKLERKRARNRAAASKCRQKKMDRINELENQVQAEKVRSQMLDSELLRLRAAMAQLENIVQRHQMSGSCPSAQC